MTNEVQRERVTMQDEGSVNPVDRAKEFIQNQDNIVVAEDLDEAMCGDGRTLADQSQGRMRVFGGDAGIIAAIEAAAERKNLSITPRQAVDAYLRAIRKIRGAKARIGYHTDDHSKREGKIGCGDMLQAQNPDNEDLYGASSKGIKEMFDYVKSLPHDDAHETILQGGHNEAWALIIEGKDGKVPEYTINSMSRDGKDSGFVVDMGRVRDFIGKITPELGIGEIDEKDVESALAQRMGATASLLAAGKPLISVEMDGSKATIIDAVTIMPKRQ